MSKISISKILRRTSLVAAVATMMTVGSVANALNSLQFEQSTKPANSAQASAMQLAHVICQGNWVNAGCTTPPDSGRQGNADKPTPRDTNPCSSRFYEPAIVLQAQPPCRVTCC